MNTKILGLLLIILSDVLFSNDVNHKKESYLIEQTALFPKQIGSVNDFENDFTAKQIEELEQVLSNFKKTKHKNIVIASVKSFASYSDFKEFTVDLANNWKLKNTVFIVFSKNKRKIALSITKDVTGLTDQGGKKIVSEIIIPRFKENNYYTGIKTGVIEFTHKWK